MRTRLLDLLDNSPADATATSYVIPTTSSDNEGASTRWWNGRKIHRQGRQYCRNSPQVTSYHVRSCVSRLGNATGLVGCGSFAGSALVFLDYATTVQKIRQTPESSRWTILPRRCVRHSLRQSTVVSGWRKQPAAGLCQTVFRDLHGKRYVWQNALIVSIVVSLSLLFRSLSIATSPTPSPVTESFLSFVRFHESPLLSCIIQQSHLSSIP